MEKNPDFQRVSLSLYVLNKATHTNAIFLIAAK